MSEFNLDHAMTELVGTFTDPIIVYDEGWGETLPDWIRQRIRLERLLENITANNKGDGHLGTGAEVVAYIYTASLAAPISEDWARIYIHVAGQEYRLAGAGQFPDDLRIDSLTSDQERKLNQLKAWIYRMRLQARKERAKQARQEAKRNHTRQLAFSLE